MKISGDSTPFEGDGYHSRAGAASGLEQPFTPDIDPPWLYQCLCSSAAAKCLRQAGFGIPRLALCDNDADGEVWEAGLILSLLSEKWRHAVSMKVGEDLLKLSRNSFTEWLDV